MKHPLRAPTGARVALCRRAMCVALMAMASCLGAFGQLRGQEPPAGRPVASLREPGEEVYQLRNKPAAEVEAILSDMLVEFGSAAQWRVDSQSNQIVVRGPRKAQQIVQQLIESVDRPPAKRPSGKPVVKAYPVRRGLLSATTTRLRSRYSGRSDIRIASDPQSSQLVILAPPEIHAGLVVELVAPELHTKLETTRSSDVDRMVASIPTERFVELRFSRLDRVESQMRRLLGSRLELLAGRRPGRVDYLFVDASRRRVELSLDGQRNGLLLVGTQSLVGQLAKLIRALDTSEDPRAAPEKTLLIVPVRQADPAKVREAVDAYRGGSLDRGRGNRQPIVRRDARAVGQAGRFHRSRGGNIELVQHLAQRDGPGAGTAPPREGPVEMSESELKAFEQDDRPLREMGEEVDIETLPDLDVIILRGRQHDVDEVSRIIAEIERLSAETEPAIEVYLLRNVHCQSLARIVEQVEDDLIGGRQGRVSVIPLVKPNALLLIGWGEAVNTIKELLDKLDQPDDPNSRWKVFRLRHASAARAADTLEGFFDNSDGLGPQIDVTADPRTNALVVRGSPRDLHEAELLIGRLDRADSNAVSQARLFKLQYSLADDLADTLEAAIRGAAGTGSGKSTVLELLTVDPEGERILKSGLLDDVRITPDEHTNAILVAAPAESMELLAALIKQLDSPTAVAQIKVFEVANGDANSLIQMLRMLLPTQSGGGPQLAGAEGETTLVPVRFSVDERTNSIIATGSQGDLAIIEALLLRLDERDVEQRVNMVYRLKNAPATDVARAINEFLRSERQIQLAAPGQVSPFEQIEREVVVVPEPVSNGLIISSTPRFYEEIEKLVEKLDEAPPQVMIQVVIAQIELNNIHEFGVELGLQDSILFDRSLLGDLITTTSTIQETTAAGVTTVTEEVIQSATNTPGFDFNNNPLGNSGSNRALERSNHTAGQALSHFAVGRINGDLSYGGLVLSAGSESVSVLIRALQERRRLEILGRPQIMTLDNQSAWIQVGKRVPRITGTRFDNSGAQVNQIALENTGLILGVTPRISPEGMVVMEIDAEQSELGPEQEGVPVSVNQGTVIRSPSINVTMAQTTVSAATGETIVLGGLITKNESTIERGVPWLSDVPLLGHLFRYDNTACRRKELLIMLTPHVVDSSAEADRIKQLEAARMSWCLADVHAMHGPTGIVEDLDSSHLHGHGKVIYPDMHPRGLPPGHLLPEENLPPDLPLSPSIEQIPAPDGPQGSIRGGSSEAGQATAPLSQPSAAFSRPEMQASQLGAPQYNTNGPAPRHGGAEPGTSIGTQY